MSDTEVVCDSFLFQRLRGLPDAGIDALVDIITDHGRGRTSLDSAVNKALVMARYNPRPGRYSNLNLKHLAHELQHFGGHSMANAIRRFRDKPPVSYETVVNDVHSKLNGASTKTKSIEDKEREVALALFGKPDPALSLAERIERCTSKKVLTGLFDIKDSPLVGKDKKTSRIPGSLAAASKYLPAAGLLGTRLNPALAVVSAPLLIHAAAAEAYRITIPFVAEMGWIGLCSEAFPAESKLEPATPSPTHKGHEITLATEDGGVLMRFSAPTDTSEQRGKKRVPRDAINTLNPLLSNIPGVATFTEQQRSNLVVCSVPFEALVDSATGPEGSKRAIVMGAKGIDSHAHLSAPDALENVVISGVAWNALSSAVGQKHLHDINEKLNDIKEQLDELGDNLDRTRTEKLEGLIVYAQSLLDHQAEGINSRALDVLEHNLPVLSSLESFFRDKMDQELKRVADLETEKVLGAGKLRTDIEASTETMNRWIEGYLQVAQLQLISLWLLNRDQPSQRYVSSAEAVVNRLAELDERLLDSVQVFRAQMSMSSFLSKLEDSQAVAFETRVQTLQDQTVGGRNETQAWYQRLFEQGECQMLLEINDAGIVDAYY